MGTTGGTSYSDTDLVPSTSFTYQGTRHQRGEQCERAVEWSERDDLLGIGAGGDFARATRGEGCGGDEFVDAGVWGGEHGRQLDWGRDPRVIDGQVFTVSDTRGNTYRRAVEYNETVDATTLGVYYAENIAGGTNTVTVSDTLGGTLRFAIVEYAGVATSNSLDVVTVGAGDGHDAEQRAVTTTANGDLVLALLSTANGTTFTAGSGYTLQEQVPAAPNAKLIIEDQRQATACPVLAGGVLSSADIWGAVVAGSAPAKARSSRTEPGPRRSISRVRASHGNVRSRRALGDRLRCPKCRVPMSQRRWTGWNRRRPSGFAGSVRTLSLSTVKPTGPKVKRHPTAISKKTLSM